MLNVLTSNPSMSITQCPIGGVLDFEQLSTDDWTYLKLYQLHAHTVLRNMQLICSQHVHELRSCTPE